MAAVAIQRADERGVRRARINALEQAMLAMPHAHVEFPTFHHFADGLYAREIEIQAGTMLTGKVHRTEHLNILAKGRIKIATDEGLREFVAPCTFVAPPGTKKAGLAIEDCVWITVHATRETDLDRLERELTADSYERFEHLRLDERMRRAKFWVAVILLSVIAAGAIASGLTFWR